jgi:hypothetical protein
MAARKYDVIRWATEDECPTGNECSPGGKCWGNDANYKCFNKDITNEKGPTEMRWIGEDYMIFAHHTCIKSWECIIHKEVIEPIKLGIAPMVKIGITLPIGEVWILNDKTYLKATQIKKSSHIT